MAEEATGFFRFDTNAGIIAEDIGAAMAEIKASLNKPVNTTEIGVDVGNLSKVFDRMKMQAVAAAEEIQGLMSKASMGVISPNEFVSSFGKTVRAQVRAIPQTLANELSTAPETSAMNVEAGLMAGRYSDSFVNGAIAQVRARWPEMGKALAGGMAGVPGLRDAQGRIKGLGAFAMDQRQVAENPIAYDSGNAITQYRNLVRAQQMVRDEVNAGGLSGGEPSALEKATGFDVLTKRIRAAQVTAHPDYGYQFTPDPYAKKRLDELIATEAKGAPVAQRLQRENQNVAKATEEMGRAAALADVELRKGVRGSLILPSGETQQLTAAGTKVVTNPAIAKLQQMADEQAAAKKANAEMGAIQAQAITQNKQYDAAQERQHAEALRVNKQYDRDYAAQQSAAITQNKAFDEQAATATETANRRKLLTAPEGAVTQTRGYSILGNEVYKVSGARAALVTSEEEILFALQGQEKVMAEQLAIADKLAMADTKRVAKQDLSTAGFATGFASRFERQGGNFSTNLGAQVGQAASFTIGYAALFATLGMLKNVKAQYADYKDSLTDLEVATRSTDVVSQSWVNTLGDIARVTGENVGAALDTAARGIRAFGDPMGNTTDQLQAIGEAANTAATQLSLVARKSLPDATGDTIAIGTAYGLVPDQLNQVVDAVANAKRSLGGDPGQISQGLALISSSAKTAGFDLNQAAAVISLVQARTDESGQAAATRLTRIFQIVSGTTGKGLGRELGVDTNQSVRKQLEDYAKIYNDPGTSTAVKNRITSAVGGTANLRELMPLLAEGARLTAAYGQANSNAGQGTAEFVKNTDNLTGTFKKISGDIKFIETDLARTNLFAPFGVAVYTLEPVLHLLDRMLELIDAMPGGVRTTVAALVDLALAAKAVSVVQGAVTAGRATKAVAAGEALLAQQALSDELAQAQVVAQERLLAATQAREEAEATFDGVVIEAARAREVAELASVEKLGAASTAAATGSGIAAGAGPAEGGLLAGLAARGGMAGGLGTILSTLINPWVLAGAAVIGSAVLMNKILDGIDQKAKFLNSERAGANAFGRIDASSASALAAVHDLRSTAGEIQQSDSNAVSAQTQKETSAALLSQARGLTFLARRTAKEEAGSPTGAGGVFGAGGVISSVSQLAAGLTALDASGATATRSMRQLEKAITRVVNPYTQPTYHPAAFAQQAIGTLVGTLPGAIPAGTQARTPLNQRNGELTRFGSAFSNQDTFTTLSNDEAYALAAPDKGQIVKMNAAITAAAKKYQIQAGHPITPAQEQILTKAALDSADLSDLPKAGREIRRRWLLLALQKMAVDNGAPMTTSAALNVLPFQFPAGIAAPAPLTKQQMLNGRGRLSRNDVMNLFDPSPDGSYVGLAAKEQAALSAIPAGDSGAKLIRTQTQYVASLKALAARNKGKDIGRLNLEITNAEDALSSTMVTHLEALRTAAVSRPGLTHKQIKFLDQSYWKKELKQAGTDDAMLIQIMSMADQATLDLVGAQLKKAADAEAEANRISERDNALRHSQGDSLQRAAPKKTAENRYRGWQKDLALSPTTKDPFGFGSGSSGSSKAAKDTRTAGQRAADAAAAGIDPDRVIAQARADLNVALANLHAAKKGSTEYNSALSAVAQARDTLAKDMASQTSDVAAANAARTGGGIAQARSSLIAASAQLHSTAKGTAAWYQALASFFDAQRSMRDAVLQYKANLDQLHGDMTDPVENARDALRAAARTLASDRRAGQGKDVIAADRVAAEQARNALQSSKFQQRLSDMQTAEQLGQMSFGKYMSYLDHEHDRLSKIHKRTRQQQDELNTIDQALKDALNSMDSQFNLGAINTSGLVYQERRFAAQNRYNGQNQGGSNSHNRTETTNNHVVIHAPDAATVRRVLESMGFRNGETRTSRSRKS